MALLLLIKRADYFQYCKASGLTALKVVIEGL